MKGASLTKADNEEAISLRRYSQLRLGGKRQDMVASQDLVAGAALGTLLCSLQLAILLLSNGWAEPILASATLAFCLGVSLRLVLTLPAEPSQWRRRQPTDAELLENEGH